MKKQYLTLGAFLAITTPIVSVISCGESKNSINNKKGNTKVFQSNEDQKMAKFFYEKFKQEKSGVAKLAIHSRIKKDVNQFVVTFALSPKESLELVKQFGLKDEDLSEKFTDSYLNKFESLVQKHVLNKDLLDLTFPPGEKSYVIDASDPTKSSIVEEYGRSFSVEVGTYHPIKGDSHDYTATKDDHIELRIYINKLHPNNINDNGVEKAIAIYNKESIATDKTEKDYFDRTREEIGKLIDSFNV